MVPVLELRFAIPFGVTRGLGLKVSMAVSILGNLVPVPFIIVFIRRVFSWLRSKNESFNKMVSGLEARAESKRHIVVRYAFWGLVILVAIPLPGTGAWTGALVAAMMRIRLRRAFPAVALGVVIAAFVVSVITYGARMVF
ncbi:MAG: small multi-drug export protein [Oscillospiraceae bacterium]|nr:small multi-drug export protein [Oscillospiraceae bacterium]MBR3544853.1 small multi-drug export protein [Oscillospiraceae bacterium]